ncbi:MAG: hypothetical protein FJY07_13485 [Bacteroidetes bacterium]|nr:hypothetical protein [Bacteroidota bacterium]
MKSLIKITVVFADLFLVMVGMNILIAQEPPYSPANGHGQTSNQPPPGGGAPLDGVLIAFSLIYLGKKMTRKEPVS